jgi:glucuronoarabinoxylan endo-1,4-beta-xylanase
MWTMKKKLKLIPISLVILTFSVCLFGQTLGDANNNGTVDIVDALLMAQYYVGLNPPGFYSAVADVNCSGGIDIVDALLIAQLYVGLITQFPCTTTPAPTSVPTATPTIAPNAAAINLGSIQQVIDGFGGATVGNGQLTDAEMDALFGNANASQIGLTICRVKFSYDSNFTEDQANATKAKARGATVFASVWSPPASMKSNGSVVGGSLNASSYAAYATWLSNARASFGNVDIVSIQNEPNVVVNYESCTWTPQQLLDFCKNNAQNIGCPVMMPEAYNFDDAYSDPTLNDATAASHISYVAGHLYGGGLTRHSNAIAKGKKVWMTEHFFDGDDIGTCMTMAKEILDCVNNSMNAYVWWYLKTPNCNLINAGGSLQKKGYIMGQFSKYVRPGYNRVDATYNPQSSVYVCAFKGAKNVIIAINQSTSTKSQQFVVQNGSMTSVTKYTTSGSKSLSSDGSIALSGGTVFTSTLDPQSVSTFVQN